MNEITLALGLTDAERTVAAELYFDAFRQKLGPILGVEGEGLLARTFCLDRAICARRGKELVGIAGFKLRGRALVGIQWSDMQGTYGVPSGALRSIALSILERPARDRELLMDGIVVAPSSRGQGVGSALLERVVEFAQDQKLAQVRLDVVDTNPGARRLYDRHGFESEKTESVAWLRRWLGFGASTTMVRRVAPTDAS